jgi:hypothetical protein
VEPLLKHRGSGEKIAGQQEIQYLPAAVGQLEEPKSPTATQHKDILGCLVSSGDLLACRHRLVVLPICVLGRTRFFDAFLQECAAEAEIAVWTRYAGRSGLHSEGSRLVLIANNCKAACYSA